MHQHPLLPFSSAFPKNQSRSLNPIKVKVKFLFQRLALYHLYSMCEFVIGLIQ